MTRREQNMQLIITYPDHIIFIKKLQFGVIINKRQFPKLTGNRPIFQYRFFKVMNMQDQFKSLMDKVISENMIKMTVRIEQIYGFELVLFYKILQLFFLAGEITTG